MCPCYEFLLLSAVAPHILQIFTNVHGRCEGPEPQAFLAAEKTPHAQSAVLHGILREWRINARYH